MAKSKQKRYEIEVREIHAAFVHIEAESREEAWKKYEAGEGEWTDGGSDGYLYTLESDEVYTTPTYDVVEI